MNTRILNVWAKQVYMPLPETWDAAAVGALCVWLCKYSGYAGMYFADLREEEECEIKELLAQKKQARCARAMLLPAEKSLRRKAPFFADKVKNLIAIADTQIARADDAEREGIIFERRPPASASSGSSGRPKKPTSAKISELEKDLNNILIAGGVDVQNERARRIVALIEASFPGANPTPGSVIQRII